MERHKKTLRLIEKRRRKDGSRLRQCILGVAAMDKKTRSKPMTQILDRLRAYGEFLIIVFGESLLLDESIPIEKWPVVDCLIAFHSGGYPLARVAKYVELRKPFCINDVVTQNVLQSRTLMYQTLERHGIPTPFHLYADRENGKECTVEEFDEYIIVNGTRMNKPVVEKPFDADDHNVHIHYSKSMGGGCRKLFRKVKNQSSSFHPEVNTLRRDTSYVYEEFMGGATDLKVYTIGPGYAHGELRKSPAIDGIVERDPDGKELRLLTRLTREEQQTASDVCKAFQQNICGFDLIRYKGRSYVIDVNGWSFVKGNLRYYDKCARAMRKMFLGCTRGRNAMALPRPLPAPFPSGRGVYQDGDSNDVLRCIVSIFRHADRTPKQKVKLKTKDPALLALLPKGDPTKELKVKNRVKLDVIKDVVAGLIAEARAQRRTARSAELEAQVQAEIAENMPLTPEEGDADTPQQPVPAAGADSKAHPDKQQQQQQEEQHAKKKNEPEDKEEAARLAKAKERLLKLLHVQTVLTEEFGNTKVQLKPKKVKDGKVTEALLVCKWGGEMTHAGTGQAEQYAPVFWDEMIRPPHSKRGNRFDVETREHKEKRLAHPTYRAHRAEFLRNMQVYTSDEARVQASARAFLQSTLDHNEVDGKPDALGTIDIHAGEEVQVFLDDTKLAEESIAKAKQTVALLVSSDQKETRDQINFKLRMLDGVNDLSECDISRLNEAARAHDDEKKKEKAKQKKKKQKGQHQRKKPPQKQQQQPASGVSNATGTDSGAPIPFNLPAATRASSLPEPSLPEPLTGLSSLSIADSAALSASGSVAPEQQQKPQLQQPPRHRHVSDTASSQSSPAPSINSTVSSRSGSRRSSLESAGSVNLGSSKSHRPRSKWKGSKRNGNRTSQSHSKGGDLGNAEVGKAMTAWGQRCLRWLGNRPRNYLLKLYDLMRELQALIHSRMEAVDLDSLNVEFAAHLHAHIGLDAPRRRLRSNSMDSLTESVGAESYGRSGDTKLTRSSSQKKMSPFHLLCHRESLLLMKERWDSLVDSIYNVKKKEWDPTKIPDVYDAIKYDVLHNEEFLRSKHFRPLYRCIKRVADFVIPQEYGVTKREKQSIGRRVVKPLVAQMLQLLESGLEEDPHTRTHLFFSSESHLHCLRNVFLLGDLSHNHTVATALESVEINYMSHGTLRLFEDPSKPLDDPYRFYVNVIFSPGAALDPFVFKEEDHLLPVSRPYPVNCRIPLDKFRDRFEWAMEGNDLGGAHARTPSQDYPPSHSEPAEHSASESRDPSPMPPTTPRMPQRPPLTPRTSGVAHDGKSLSAKEMIEARFAEMHRQEMEK